MGRAGRDLRPLFDPTTIAVIGASEDPGKWGRWLAEGALRGAGRRQVHFVNRRGGPILGQPSFKSARELPDAPELAVIAVPLSSFEDAVDDVLAAGARAVVAVNAGFAEMGNSGRERQQRLTERVRAAGAVLVGPNCLGVVDTTTQLEAAWLQLGPTGLVPGPVGLISQSGTVALDIAILASDAGIGISRLVSLGNQADVTVTELVQSYALHEDTTVLALYCEDFRDGREFLQATRAAVAAGKPVILLAAGASDASSRAAQSHTGALTTDARVVETVCRATGAIKADTPAEMVDVMQLLVRSPSPAGVRVGVASDGGGHGVVAADTVNRAGLLTPEFSPSLQATLREMLDDSPATSNPIDLALANIDPTAFRRVVEVLATSGEVDAVMLSGSFGGWGAYNETLSAKEADAGRAMADTAASSGVPVVLQTMIPQSAPALAAREAGLPVFRTPEAAADALHRVASARRRRATGVPSIGPGQARRAESNGYFDVRRLLAAHGVVFPNAREVTSVETAVAAADEIGYPVVVKAAALLHKSDQGGVALDLGDARAVRRSIMDMRDRLACNVFSVESMVDASDGVEVVVGARRDPRFGQVLAVGLGGTLTEVFDDVQLALAPAEVADVAVLFRELRGKAVLEGPRGSRPVDVEQAAHVAATLSRVAAADARVAEIEINPLLVRPTDAVALDARLVLETDRDG